MVFSSVFGVGVGDAALPLQYALVETAPAELKVLERVCRSTCTSTSATTRARWGMVQPSKMRSAASAARARHSVVLEHGVLPSLVVILRAARGCCRAAAALAELCASAEVRRAREELRAAAARRDRGAARASRGYRARARVLSALAAEPAATDALLREAVPRALRHLCRSSVVQAHALSVHALGRSRGATGRCSSRRAWPRSSARLRRTPSSRRASPPPPRSASSSSLAPAASAPAPSGSLRCCDVLNVPLKVAALHGLATLLAGAGMPVEAAAHANAATRDAEPPPPPPARRRRGPP